MSDNINDNGFYEYIKYISIAVAILIVYALIDIGDYFGSSSTLLADLRNMLIAILVGLLFSFLLTVKSLREYILKSISNFMTDNSYIKKLGTKELKELRENVMKAIHGVDIVSNGESLYNHLAQLDRFHSTPHKSIVNEKWIFGKSEHDNMFELVRIQDYRIHTLDRDTHKEFELVVKSQLHASVEDKDKVIDSIKIIISVNGASPVTIDKDSEELIIKYNEKEKELLITYQQSISLEKEFTKVHIESHRLEEIEFSQAVYSSHATYGLNYDITLPDGYSYDDVYHSNTLDLKEENVSVHKEEKELSVNINGWQLPGLIFVYTYKKVNP